MKDNINLESLINTYGYILKLKKIKRRGWLLNEIKDIESVADHIFALAFLAVYLIKEDEYDLKKVLVQIIIHEIAETTIGDITPNDNITYEQKQIIEKKAAYEILTEIDKTGELYSYWEDFELKNSKEGIIVKDLDKLELVLQAYSYENEEKKNLNEFYLNAKRLVSNKKIYELIQELYNKRDFR